ncbi:DUF5658 family protein [Niallia nealsonii]
MLDAFFTYIGLRYNLILESNPLMNTLWMVSPFLFLFLKILLSLLLIFFFFFFTAKNRKSWCIILSIPVCLYFVTLILHISWVIALISF